VDVNPLERWLTDVATALGVGESWSPADRDLVLDLARDVAHGVARPAAPLTTYLAGIAVGHGLTPAEAAEVIAGLVAAHPPTGPQ
jgi:Domain of unknown function (DUF6457)